jgi:hypothetical protein
MEQRSGPTSRFEHGFLGQGEGRRRAGRGAGEEGVEEVQTKRNLSHAYEELGHTAFDLINEGQISHDRMTALAEEIRKLQAAAPAEPAGAAGAPTGGEGPASG